MLYPSVFESLYELNVSRLRRLIYSCHLAEEERYLPLAVTKAMLKKEGLATQHT